MKKHLKYTPLAIALAAFVASPLVMAEGNGNYHHNKKDVTFDKDIRVNSNVNLIGGSLVLGITRVEAASIALVKDKQENYDNTVKNVVQDNDATVEDQALENASGNIGLNMTAGNNNQQANDAALSAVDANFVFADAETFSNQDNSGNVTKNSTITNDAIMTDQAFKNASGNIGINISAGNSNQQKNDFAASVNASGTFAQATSKGSQSVDGNVTKNVGSTEIVASRVEVSLSGSLQGGYEGGGSGGYRGRTGGSYSGTEGGSYSGTEGGSYSGRTSASSTGTADQIGNLYVDNWSAGNTGLPNHPTDGTLLGHSDFDSAAQGAVDLNGDGGALAFNTASNSSGSENGSYSGTERGSYSGRESGNYRGGEAGILGFGEAGDVALAGTFTGYVPTQVVLYKPQTNVASISDQVLQNASGNIGVNVTAGFNNQQRNSLSIAAALGGSSLPGSTGE